MPLPVDEDDDDVVNPFELLAAVTLDDFVELAVEPSEPPPPSPSSSSTACAPQALNAAPVIRPMARKIR